MAFYPAASSPPKKIGVTATRGAPDPTKGKQIGSERVPGAAPARPRRAPGRQEEERGRRRNEAWLKIAGEKFLSSCLEGKSRSPAPRLALSGLSDTFWGSFSRFLEDPCGFWPPFLREIVPKLPKFNNLVSRSSFDAKHGVPAWELSFPSPGAGSLHPAAAGIAPRGFPGGIWGDLAPKEIPKLLGGGGRRGWMTQGAGELPAGWGEERPRTKPYRTKPYRTKPFLSCPAKAQSCFGLALKGESQAGHPKTRC